MIGDISLILCRFFNVQNESLRSCVLKVVMKSYLKMKMFKVKSRIINQKYCYSNYESLEISNNYFIESGIEWKRWIINWFGVEELYLALKIARQVRNQISKKVIRRNYSNDQVIQVNETIVNNIFKIHDHQNFTHMEGEFEVEKLITETVYSWDIKGEKYDWTKQLTEELNSKAPEIKKVFNKFENEGRITAEQKKKIIGSGELKLVYINTMKRKKVEMIMVKNFTTSKKKCDKYNWGRKNTWKTSK